VTPFWTLTFPVRKAPTAADAFPFEPFDLGRELEAPGLAVLTSVDMTTPGAETRLVCRHSTKRTIIKTAVIRSFSRGISYIIS